VAISYAAAAALVCVGLLMVSNLTYFSPKKMTLKGRVPFVSLVVLVLLFAVVLVEPARVLLALFVAYALSGPMTYLWGLRRRGPSSD
jgi:CDP-diacylglycerol--serine O-phosphatidyltransferase